MTKTKFPGENLKMPTKLPFRELFSRPFRKLFPCAFLLKLPHFHLQRTRPRARANLRTMKNFQCPNFEKKLITNPLQQTTVSLAVVCFGLTSSFRYLMALKLRLTDFCCFQMFCCLISAENEEGKGTEEGLNVPLGCYTAPSSACHQVITTTISTTMGAVQCLPKQNCHHY